MRNTQATNTVGMDILNGPDWVSIQELVPRQKNFSHGIPLNRNKKMNSVFHCDTDQADGSTTIGTPEGLNRLVC